MLGQRTRGTACTQWLMLLLILCAVAFSEDSIVVDDVELRIDFSSGAVIANEAPTVLAPVPDYLIVLGTKDTVVGTLTEIFTDAENGSRLNFSAEVQHKDLVRYRISAVDSTLKLMFDPEGPEGRTSVIIRANDGTKEVSDTFDIIIQKLFDLPGTLIDQTVKSGSSSLQFRRNITTILPTSSHPDSTYSFYATSSNEALVTVSTDPLTNQILMDVVDSGYGTSTITVTVFNSDGFSRDESFVLTVKQRFGVREYHRKREPFNPGITLFTGMDYSGFSCKFWANDVFGTAIGGYYQWDKKGIGADMQLLVKPPVNFFMQPYMLASCGYHRQSVTVQHQTAPLTLSKEIPMLVVRGGGGLDFWLGNKKQHVLGMEVGFTYGRKTYATFTSTLVGDGDVDFEETVFELPPLHLRVAYSVYFKAL